MEEFYRETQGEYTFTLYAELETEDYHDNCSASGDDAVDAAYEAKIAKRLEAGDIWAWCWVRVTCEFEHLPGVLGIDSLGGCCYASYKEFVRPGGYYSDLKATAKADLWAQAGKAVETVASLRMVRG